MGLAEPQRALKLTTFSPAPPARWSATSPAACALTPPSDTTASNVAAGRIIAAKDLDRVGAINGSGLLALTR
jgi:hypothetical protein